MAKQPPKTPAQETAPNAYTRAELEGLSKTTGIPVEQLWAMPRRTVQQLTKDAAAAQIEQQRKTGEENAKIELERTRARDKVEADKLEAGRPLAERHPWGQQLATGGGALAPLLMPILSRRYSPDQKLIRKWDKAVDQAEAAQAAARNGTGTLADAAAATERAQAFQSQYKPKSDTVGSKALGLLNDAKTVGGGVLVSTEAPMVPALLDRFTQERGTRARDEADKKFTQQEFLDRLIASGPITAGISATGLKVGSMMNRNAGASQARTDALRRQAEPGWSAGPQAMGSNYAGATNAELPLIDARSAVASARRDAARLDAAPQTPRGLLAPEPSPAPAPRQQSQPPAEPLQNPSTPPVAQPTLPEPVAARQLSAPATGASGELPPAGPWAQNWSAPARESIDAHLAGGGSIAERVGLTGGELKDMIAARLMPGVKPPSLTEVKDRLAALRGEVGPNPKPDDVQKVWVKDKDGRLFAIPAAMATGASGYGLLSPSEAEASGYYPDRGPRRGLLQLD